MGNDDVYKNTPMNGLELDFKFTGFECKTRTFNLSVKPKHYIVNMDKKYGELRKELFDIFPYCTYERHWKVVTGLDPDINKNKKSKMERKECLVRRLINIDDMDQIISLQNTTRRQTTGIRQGRNTAKNSHYM